MILPPSFISQPPEKAIEYFAAKGIVISPNSWRDIWEAAHSRVFTVAKIVEDDVLKLIKSELDAALESGISQQNFKKVLIEKLESAGFLEKAGLAAHRIDNIYRTNTATAYNVGRYVDMKENVQFRPYWQYMAVLDSKTRPHHAAMSGRVYPANSPVWSRWWPPCGFRCRCYVRALRQKDIERMKLKLDSELPEVEENGVKVKATPDLGFRYNPGEAGLANIIKK